MHTIIQAIGVICCAIIMGVAAILGRNYLEVNIWWFYILEPMLIIIFMGGCLIKSLITTRKWHAWIALLLFLTSTITTGILTKKAFDYGQQIPTEVVVATNKWAADAWNTYTPDIFHVDIPTEATYMDHVGQAGIRILRHYGNDVFTIGYFELNLILYAFLFPGIALYFAILWKKRKYQTAVYSAFPICIGTLLMSVYLFNTLPLSI